MDEQATTQPKAQHQKRRPARRVKSPPAKPAANPDPAPTLDSASPPASPAPPAPSSSATRRSKSVQPRKLPVPVQPDSDAGPPEMPQRPALSRPEAIQELVRRANAGNEACLAGLRQILDGSPEIWQTVGDLARHCELAWSDLTAGDDHLMVESIKRQVADMKVQLAGPTPSPLESILVDQAVCTWLATKHAEMDAAKPGRSGLGEASFKLKHCESAQKRHLAALKTLAMIRALRLGTRSASPTNRGIRAD